VPFKLPEYYRCEPPSEPKKLKDMKIDGTLCAVEYSAVFIDREWGVWLDPNAVAQPYGPMVANNSNFVIVSRQPDGYYIRTFTARQKWKRGVEPPYQSGMIPVAGLLG
jgi:hypothetical protein